MKFILTTRSVRIRFSCHLDIPHSLHIAHTCYFSGVGNYWIGYKNHISYIEKVYTKPIISVIYTYVSLTRSLLSSRGLHLPYTYQSSSQHNRSCLFPVLTPTRSCLLKLTLALCHCMLCGCFVRSAILRRSEPSQKDGPREVRSTPSQTLSGRVSGASPS